MPVVQTDPRAGPRPRSPAGNLPVELSSFVGRSRELSEIKRLLQVAPAITLTGPGGIGKTRLALRAGRKLARHFPDGVFFVELAEVERPELGGLRAGPLAAGAAAARRGDRGRGDRPSGRAGGRCSCSTTASTCSTPAGGS